METGSLVEAVEQQVEVMLSEMSQNLQMSSIRLLAYLLNNAMKRLFTSVNVNMDGLPRVRGGQFILRTLLRVFLFFLFFLFSFLFFLCISYYCHVCCETLFSNIRVGQ